MFRPWQAWRNIPWKEVNLKTFVHGLGLRTLKIANVFCALHLFSIYVGRPVMMAGPSMLPTFDHTGEVVIESRLGAPYDRRTLTRGELVSFYSPLDPMRLVCKRVLGLPGDIVCVDPSGKYAPPEEHVVVPEGHVWLAGDNLAWSRDSRVYGPVPMSLIAGKIKARIWPPFKPIPEWPTGRTT